MKSDENQYDGDTSSNENGVAYENASPKTVRIVGRCGIFCDFELSEVRGEIKRSWWIRAREHGLEKDVADAEGSDDSVASEDGSEVAKGSEGGGNWFDEWQIVNKG